MWMGTRAALLLMSCLASETAAQCPSDMNVAPSVPGLSGVEVNGAQCVCPATSYYWRTGFIFCFDKSKAYSQHITDQDDEAFRVTYGRYYDLVDGWNRYTTALPGADSSRQRCKPSDIHTTCTLQACNPVPASAYLEDITPTTCSLVPGTPHSCMITGGNGTCSHLTAEPGKSLPGHATRGAGQCIAAGTGTCEYQAVTVFEDYRTHDPNDASTDDWISEDNADYQECMRNEDGATGPSKLKAKCLWSRGHTYKRDTASLANTGSDCTTLPHCSWSPNSNKCSFKDGLPRCETATSEAECVDEGPRGGDSPYCEWNGASETCNQLEVCDVYSEGDDDRDWRYHRDPQTENDIPGLLRLQHPEIFTPRVVTPNCLPCPPCADCSREGTATIATGWGMGQTSQQVYRGLLKGAENEFKTLPNRPGTAALGPVLVQETVPVWEEQYNLRPKIQFKARECIGDSCYEPASSSQCSFKDDREDLVESDEDCPESHYNDVARDEWSAKMAPVPDDSIFRWQFMLPMFCIISGAFYALRGKLGARRTIIGWVVFVIVFYMILYPVAVSLHKQDIADAKAAQTTWRTEKSLQIFGNSTCGVRCLYTTDFNKAATDAENKMATHGGLSFRGIVSHKTLFRCPTETLCPAESVYFDKGVYALGTCLTEGLEYGDLNGDSIIDTLDFPFWRRANYSKTMRDIVRKSDSGRWACATDPSRTCTDAGNWKDIRGHDCDWYGLHNSNETMNEQGGFCDRDYLEGAFWSSYADARTKLTNYTWSPSNITALFAGIMKSDITAYASSSGLHALDACCICGGGGTQKESLQQCDAVVVETVEVQEPVEKSDITNYLESTLSLASAGKEETITTEITTSKLSNRCTRGQKVTQWGEEMCENPKKECDPRDSANGITPLAECIADADEQARRAQMACKANPEQCFLTHPNTTGPYTRDAAAGQGGSMCAGCQRYWIAQGDEPCSKCAKQDTKGAIWVFSICLGFVVHLHISEKKRQFEKNAIERAMLDLRASEDSKGRPLFKISSQAKQDVIAEVLSRDAKTEKAIYVESLNPGAYDLRMWEATIDDEDQNRLLEELRRRCSRSTKNIAGMQDKEWSKDDIRAALEKLKRQQQQKEEGDAGAAEAGMLEPSSDAGAEVLAEDGAESESRDDQDLDADEGSNKSKRKFWQREPDFGMVEKLQSIYDSHPELDPEKGPLKLMRKVTFGTLIEVFMGSLSMQLAVVVMIMQFMFSWTFVGMLEFDGFVPCIRLGTFIQTLVPAESANYWDAVETPGEDSCSVWEWYVHPYIRATLTPVIALLLWDVLSGLGKRYAETYGKFLKPLTQKHQETQQRMETAAHLFGGAGRAGTVVSAEESLMDQLKIVTVSFQLMTQLPFVLNFEFPPEVKLWFERFKILNLDIFGDFSITCLIDEYTSEFRFLYFKFSVYMLLPPVLIFIVYRSYKAKERELERNIQRKLTEQDHTIIHPPKEIVESMRLRLKQTNRSTVVHITNRTNEYLHLMKGETRVEGKTGNLGKYGGAEFSSSPIMYDVSYDKVESEQMWGCVSLKQYLPCFKSPDPDEVDNEDKGSQDQPKRLNNGLDAGILDDDDDATKEQKQHEAQEAADKREVFFKNTKDENEEYNGMTTVAEGLKPRVPLFRALQPVCMDELAQRLEKIEIPEGKQVPGSTPGEVCTDMFFIKSGTIKFVDPKEPDKLQEIQRGSGRFALSVTAKYPVEYFMQHEMVSSGRWKFEARAVEKAELWKLSKVDLHHVANEFEDWSKIEVPELERGMWGRLVACFGLEGTYPAVAIAPETSAADPEGVKSSRRRVNRLLDFQTMDRFSVQEYSKSLDKIKDMDWDVRQDGSTRRMDFPSIIPPRTEVVFACDEGQKFATRGVRVWLTYKIVPNGARPASYVNSKVRLEVVNNRFSLPWKRSTVAHADVTRGSATGKQAGEYYVGIVDDDQSANNEVSFVIDDTRTDVMTDDELAEQNALERMLKKQQVDTLEEVKLQAFSRVALVLFLLYNALTSSVFGMFACYQMDFGDEYNRFDLELDCKGWLFLEVWQKAAIYCCALYPIGIPMIFALMIFTNKKELARDPNNEMTLEDFAQVVEMLDDAPSIKDISSMFDAMDEDRGGTLSVNELRSGAIGMGMSELKSAGKDADEDAKGKTLEYAHMNEVQKEDVRKLVGFGGENPAVDRLRSMLQRLKDKQSIVANIKKNADDISQAVNQCVLSATIGPVCSEELDNEGSFVAREGIQVEKRPLLLWRDLTEDEQNTAQSLKIDGTTWDQNHEADADEQAEDVENGDEEVGTRKNTARQQFQENVARIQKAFDMELHPLFDSPANVEKQKAMKKKDKTDTGMQQTDALQRAVMPVSITANDVDEQSITNTKMSPVRNAENKSLSEFSTTFGYEQIWRHQYAQAVKKSPRLMQAIDDGIGPDQIADLGLKSWWIDEHIGRYKTQPAEVIARLQKKLDPWLEVQKRRSVKDDRFFKLTWAECIQFDEERGDKFTRLAAEALMDVDKAIDLSQDAAELSKAYQTRWDKPIFEGRFWSLFNMAWSELAEIPFKGDGTSDQQARTLQDAVKRVWKMAGGGAVEYEEKEAAEEWQLLCTAMQEEGDAMKEVQQISGRQGGDRSPVAAVDAAQDGSDVVQKWPALDALNEKQKRCDSRIKAYETAAEEARGLYAFIMKKEEAIILAVNQALLEEEQAHNELIEMQALELWRHLKALSWTQISEDAQLFSMMLLLGYDEDMWANGDKAPCMFVHMEWDDLEEASIELFRSEQRWAMAMGEGDLEELWNKEPVLTEFHKGGLGKHDTEEVRGKSLKDCIEAALAGDPTAENEDDRSGTTLMKLLFKPETDGERIKRISGYDNEHKDLIPWVAKDGTPHPSRVLIQNAITSARIISKRQIGKDTVRYFSREHWNFLYHMPASQIEREEFKAKYDRAAVRFFQADDQHPTGRKYDELDHNTKQHVAELGYTQENKAKWDDRLLTLDILRPWELPKDWEGKMKKQDGQKESERKKKSGTTPLTDSQKGALATLFLSKSPNRGEDDAFEEDGINKRALLDARKWWFYLSFGMETQEQRDARLLANRDDRELRQEQQTAHRRESGLADGKLVLESLYKGTCVDFMEYREDADLDVVVDKALEGTVLSLVSLPFEGATAGQPFEGATMTLTAKVLIPKTRSARSFGRRKEEEIVDWYAHQVEDKVINNESSSAKANAIFSAYDRRGVLKYEQFAQLVRDTGEYDPVMQFQEVLAISMATDGTDATAATQRAATVIGKDRFLKYYDKEFSDSEVQAHADRLRNIRNLEYPGMPTLSAQLQNEKGLQEFNPEQEIDHPEQETTEQLLVDEFKKKLPFPKAFKDSDDVVKSTRVPAKDMNAVMRAMKWDVQFGFDVTDDALVNEAVKAIDADGDLEPDEDSGVSKGAKREMELLIGLIKANENSKEVEQQNAELRDLDLNTVLEDHTTETELEWIVEYRKKGHSRGVSEVEINQNASGLKFQNVVAWWQQKHREWEDAEAERESKWNLKKETRQQVDEIFEWALEWNQDETPAEEQTGLTFKQFDRLIRFRELEEFAEGATEKGSSQYNDLCHFVGVEDPSNGITKAGLTEIYENNLEPLDLDRDLTKLADRKKIVWPPPPQPLQEVLKVEHENSENLRNFTRCLETKVARDGRTKLFMLPASTIDALWNGRNQHIENTTRVIINGRVLFGKLCRFLGLRPITIHRTERYWKELTIDQRRAGIRLGYTSEVWDQQVDEFATPAFPKRSGKGKDGSEQDNVFVEWYNEGPLVPCTTIGKPRAVVHAVADPIAEAWQKVQELFTGDRVKYAFFVKAYRPECYYWELVEYARKFVLSGVLIFIEPGSITQVFVGSVISVTYTILVARLLPYADPMTNGTKLLAESVLAFIFICTLCMRHNLAREYFGQPEYTAFMIWVMIVGTFLPAILNVALAVGKYIDSLSLLQDSLNKGSTSGEDTKTMTLGERVKRKAKQLYLFGEQIAGAFDDLEENVTAGAEEEDNEIEEDGEKVNVEDAVIEDDDDDNDDEFSIEERTALPHAVYVQNPVTQRITPKMSPDLDAEQKAKLARIGYAEISDWEEERPASIGDKPVDADFNELTVEQQEDAKALGFTEANWKYFFIDKHYSAVVGERTEMINWLLADNRMTTAGLNALWEDYGNKTWLGRVKLTRDDVFAVVTAAWKSCERSGIQHALELYSVSYVNTFQAHVEAGIQGSDPMDFDWAELSETQRDAAEELGWEQPRWDNGGVPVTLRDENNRKRMWKDLDSLQRMSASLLGYNEDSWDQVDKLAVMNNSAMRNTVRSMARESHIGASSKIKDPTEHMEMTLVKIAHEGRVVHQLGPADTEAHIEKIAGQKELFRDCWIKTKALWQSPQLKQDRDKKSSDARSRKERVIAPFGAMNGSNWADSLAAEKIIEAILDRRRDLAMLYAEIPGPGAEDRKRHVQNGQWSSTVGTSDSFTYAILTKFKEVKEEDGTVSDIVDAPGNDGELLPCSKLPVHVLNRNVVTKKNESGVPEVVPSQVKHKVDPNARIEFVPIPNQDGYTMPDHKLNDPSKTNDVPASPDDDGYGVLDCPLSGTYNDIELDTTGKLKIYTQKEWNGLIRIQSKCQWLRLPGMNGTLVRRTIAGWNNWATERLDELLIELRTKSISELIKLAEAIQVPEHTLNNLKHQHKGFSLKSIPKPSIKGVAGGIKGIAKMTDAQAKALAATLTNAVTLEDFDQAARDSVKASMKANNPRAVFEILRQSQAVPASAMERYLGDFEAGKLKSEEEMTKLCFDVFKSKMALRMSYELTAGFAEKIQKAGEKLQKLLESKQSIVERKWVDLTEEQTQALMTLGYDADGESWDLQQPTPITAKRWSDMGLSDKCRRAARQVNLGDEAWVGWQRSWIDKGYVSAANAKFDSLTAKEKAAAKRLGYKPKAWKSNQALPVFLRPWLNTLQEIKGVHVGTSGYDNDGIKLKAEDSSAADGGSSVATTISEELLPVLKIHGIQVQLTEEKWTIEDALDIKEVVVKEREGIEWSLNSVDLLPTDDDGQDLTEHFAVQVLLPVKGEEGELESISNIHVGVAKPGEWYKSGTRHSGRQVPCTPEDYKHGMVLRVIRLKKGILRAPANEYKRRLQAKEDELEATATSATAKKIEKLKLRRTKLQAMQKGKWKDITGADEMSSDEDAEDLEANALPEPEPEPEPGPGPGPGPEQSFDAEPVYDIEDPTAELSKKQLREQKSRVAKERKKLEAEKKQREKEEKRRKKPKNKKKMLQLELQELPDNIAHEEKALENQRLSVQNQIDELKVLLSNKLAEIDAHQPGWSQHVDWGITVDIKTSSDEKDTRAADMGLTSDDNESKKLIAAARELGYNEYNWQTQRVLRGAAWSDLNTEDQRQLIRVGFDYDLWESGDLNTQSFEQFIVNNMRNTEKEETASWYTKTRGAATVDGFENWDEWGEAFQVVSKPGSNNGEAQGPKMLVSGKNQPTMDLKLVVTQLECCRKKIVPLAPVDVVDTIGKSRVDPWNDPQIEKIEKGRSRKIEKAYQACLAWQNLSTATAFVGALETLGCLVEKGSGVDIKDRHLRNDPKEWLRPEATWAQIQDPQNYEQRAWKQALLVVNKTLQRYGCNLPILRKGFEGEGIIGFLLTEIPLLGQHFAGKFFPLITMQAQIHNALLGLMLGPRDWMGDVDHKLWTDLSEAEQTSAKLLKFDKTSWNKRTHTPITRQRWESIRPVDKKGEIYVEDRCDDEDEESKVEKTAETAELKSKRFSRKKKDLTLDDRRKLEAERKEDVDKIRAAARHLWNLKEADMRARWNILADHGETVWKNLDDDVTDVALSVDIDASEWTFLTENIQKGAKKTAATRDLSSYTNLFDKGEGKADFVKLVDDAMKAVDAGFDSTTRRLLLQERVQMENKTKASSKSVARARRSMRDANEDKRRLENENVQRKKKEQAAMKKLWSSNWLDIDPDAREGAKKLGYQTNVELLILHMDGKGHIFKKHARAQKREVREAELREMKFKDIVDQVLRDHKLSDDEMAVFKTHQKAFNKGQVDDAIAWVIKLEGLAEPEVTEKTWRDEQVWLQRDGQSLNLEPSEGEKRVYQDVLAAATHIGWEELVTSETMYTDAKRFMLKAKRDQIKKDKKKAEERKKAAERGEAADDDARAPDEVDEDNISVSMKELLESIRSGRRSVMWNQQVLPAHMMYDVCHEDGPQRLLYTVSDTMEPNGKMRDAGTWPGAERKAYDIREALTTMEKTQHIKTDCTFEFALNHLWSPKPFKKLTEKEQTVLTKTFGIEEEDWNTLRVWFVSREKETAQTNRVRFAKVDEDHGFGELQEDELTNFLNNEMGWDVDAQEVQRIYREIDSDDYRNMDGIEQALTDYGVSEPGRACMKVHVTTMSELRECTAEYLEQLDHKDTKLVDTDIDKILALIDEGKKPEHVLRDIIESWNLSADGERIMKDRLASSGMSGVRRLTPNELRQKLKSTWKVPRADIKKIVAGVEGGIDFDELMLWLNSVEGRALVSTYRALAVTDRADKPDKPGRTRTETQDDKTDRKEHSDAAKESWTTRIGRQPKHRVSEEQEFGGAVFANPILDGDGSSYPAVDGVMDPTANIEQERPKAGKRNAKKNKKKKQQKKTGTEDVGVDPTADDVDPTADDGKAMFQNPLGTETFETN